MYSYCLTKTTLRIHDGFLKKKEISYLFANIFFIVLSFFSILLKGRSINNESSKQSGTNIIQKDATDYIMSHDKMPNRDKADASACSVDNEEVTEKTASTTLSISSASSSSTPMQIASSWGGLKKSFADIVKAQGIDS
jgi:hypothetical protein